MIKYFRNIQFADKDESKTIDNRCWWDPKAKCWWTVAFTPAPLLTGVAQPSVNLANPNYLPKSFSDEVQYHLAPFSDVQCNMNNFVVAARKNPNYDPNVVRVTIIGNKHADEASAIFGLRARIVIDRVILWMARLKPSSARSQRWGIGVKQHLTMLNIPL